ncbi:hypothetical protein KUTeg_007171 [Tegillarca granosa]|uniref:Uncharacterized protein n=1 Tax=Tegillarca granosa TaxID=220873 RepID=A0ABQ9FCI0_TEGGR|nr:hypothetical protein KUTeg_007171 [Tegillarca granosa]
MRGKLTDNSNMASSEDDIGNEFESSEVDHDGILSSDSILNNIGTFDDLPDALIVTNVAECVYDDINAKNEFEKVFLNYDSTASFMYLKCFRRARVNYSLPEIATKARIHLHETNICGQCVKCYFAQPKMTETHDRDPHLHPPDPVKQFLISPPASPPVGWEQVQEAKPVINYDLIAAVAQLTPGQSHELHPPSENQPAIIVHICEEPEGKPLTGGARPKIIQTRCPERTT